MKIISESRDASHYIVLQPLYFEEINSPKKEMYNYIYNKILKSNLCQNNCYNFQNIFSKDEISSYMNNLSGEYKNEIFIDNVHLSDRGNKITSKEIIKILKFKKLKHD